MTERRTARRYDLSLPVNVRTPLNREPGAQSGHTRDISTRGVYFIMERELSAGTEIDFTLTLPAEIIAERKFLCGPMAGWCAWTASRMMPAI